MNDARFDIDNEPSQVQAGAIVGEPSPMSTDAILLERLLAGGVAAFESLFRRHYQGVYQVLYRLVGDEADDLAQDVFLQLYHRPPRASGTDLGAWLYRVATNLGYNALRSRRRREHYRNTLGAITSGLGWQRARTNPEEELEQKEEQSQIHGALARLKRRQAAVLVLRYSGLSYREMAAILRVSPGSVGTLLARAELAFRRAYEQASDQDRRQGGER